LGGASARGLKGLVGRGRRPAEDFVIPASMRLEARARAFPVHTSSNRAGMPRPPSSAPPEWRWWAAWLAAFAGLPPRGQALRTAGIALPREPSAPTGCGHMLKGLAPQACSRSSRIGTGRPEGRLPRTGGETSHRGGPWPATVVSVAVVVPMNFVCAC
jgi:hypothetical protein